MRETLKTMHKTFIRQMKAYCIYRLIHQHVVNSLLCVCTPLIHVELKILSYIHQIVIVIVIHHHNHQLHLCYHHHHCCCHQCVRPLENAATSLATVMPIDRVFEGITGFSGCSVFGSFTLCSVALESISIRECVETDPLF